MLLFHFRLDNLWKFCRFDVGGYINMSEIKPSFTTPQVAQVVDIPWRKIVQFEERGLVSPSIQPASGRGSKRLWSYEDIIRCCVIRYLGSGLSSDYLRIVMEKFGSDKLIGPEMEK